MIPEKYLNDPFYKIVPTKFGDETIDVIYRKLRKPLSRAEQDALPPEERDMFSFVADFNQRTYDAAPDIICHQDVAVPLRDGTTIYVDIFLPKDSGPVPIIGSWSPFGKRPGDGFDEWQLMGVPPRTVSKMAKFESADPGFWCRNGYGIANIDPRGIGHSEGDAVFMGTQEGRDGYDFVEWCAQQPWCNGKVGLFGNSGVGMAQLRIAAECPPHLVCIAPWEATGDMYRESFREGGIPGYYAESVIGMVSGNGYIEDPLAMAQAYPLWNAYWEDKLPKYNKIRIPPYYTSNWNHFHDRGSFEGFRGIRSRQKWMRAHREFEWPDTYNYYNIQELKGFFDRFLKEINNGFEFVPKVRLEVMDAYDYDFRTNRPEKEWPLARTEYRKLYLDASNASMSPEAPAAETSVSFDAKNDILTFDYVVPEETELTGYISLYAWASVKDFDDADLFFTIKKMAPDGTEIPVHVLNEPHPGAWTKLRLSMRHLDESSKSWKPEQSFDRIEKLEDGVPVEFAVTFFPYSRIWHKGETLRLQIAGKYIRDEGWFERLVWDAENGGTTTIHSGPAHPAYLQIPFIPPKYKSCDYELR